MRRRAWLKGEGRNPIPTPPPPSATVFEISFRPQGYLEVKHRSSGFCLTRLCEDSLVSNGKVPRGEKEINKCKLFLVKIRQSAVFFPILPSSRDKKVQSHRSCAQPCGTRRRRMFLVPRKQAVALLGCAGWLCPLCPPAGCGAGQEAHPDPAHGHSSAAPAAGLKPRPVSLTLR